MEAFYQPLPPTGFYPISSCDNLGHAQVWRKTEDGTRGRQTRLPSTLHLLEAHLKGKSQNTTESTKIWRKQKPQELNCCRFPALERLRGFRWALEEPECVLLLVTDRQGREAHGDEGMHGRGEVKNAGTVVKSWHHYPWRVWDWTGEVNAEGRSHVPVFQDWTLIIQSNSPSEPPTFIPSGFSHSPQPENRSQVSMFLLQEEA